MSSHSPATLPHTIEWMGDVCRLIDQTKLPGVLEYLDITDEVEMWHAIKRLSVRGAPAIGVSAAYGLFLGVKKRNVQTLSQFKATVTEVADYLASSRPTAVNLFWALNACRTKVSALHDECSVSEALDILLRTAKEIHDDDRDRCARMAVNGANAISESAMGILTHCNAGALATGGVGTALGVITEIGKRRGITVYVDETRPLLQGARLTAWELKQAGVDYRLIADNMAASMMKQGRVDAIVTGADRIAANGDSANKIGTMPLAICAKHFGVPFYIAAPISTVDYEISSGDEIPIEEREDEEITQFAGNQTAPEGTKTANPAFDVVPHDLIEAIITEVGVIRAPFVEGLLKAKKESKEI